MGDGGLAFLNNKLLKDNAKMGKENLRNVITLSSHMTSIARQVATILYIAFTSVPHNIKVEQLHDCFCPMLFRHESSLNFIFFRFQIILFTFALIISQGGKSFILGLHFNLEIFCILMTTHNFLMTAETFQFTVVTCRRTLPIV